MAAQTLIERGAHVTMLDAGLRDGRYEGLIPDRTFVDIRNTSEEQHRFFLGDNFEGVPTGGIATGAQLTPPRQVIVRETDRFLQYRSKNFTPMESLAYGGLGAGWGLGCCVFSEAELQLAGLDPSEMRGAYQTIASRIGVSGSADDARPYTFDHVEGIQPATPLDPTCGSLLEAYGRKRTALRNRGFRLGRPALALLTRDMDGRSATHRREMEFYDDLDRAAWRPWITVDRLKESPRFRYVDGLLVMSFTEDDGVVQVRALDIHTLEERIFACRRLILATGALGSARIVLRSGVVGDKGLPLLCNPYSYLATVVPSRIGATSPALNNALGQLTLFHETENEEDGIALGALYPYRSLLLFRLALQMPLGMSDALALSRYLQPALVIAGIHHPDRPSPRKAVRRVSGPGPTADALRIEFGLDDRERHRVARREREYVRALRMLGAWTLRRISPTFGSSIHYAGTLPFSSAPRNGRLDPSGRLHGFVNVYVADGSGFSYLPAKSLTWSLMANAHLVAKRLA